MDCRDGRFQDAEGHVQVVDAGVGLDVGGYEVRFQVIEGAYFRAQVWDCGEGIWGVGGCGVEAYVDVEDGGAGCFEGFGGGVPRLGVLVMVVRWLEGEALAMVSCCGWGECE